MAGTPLIDDLHLVGVVNDRLRLGAIHAGPGDVLLLEVFLEPLHGLIGVGLDGVLHLNLQHQVAAALEIEPQADVVLEVLDQFAPWTSGKPMIPRTHTRIVTTMITVRAFKFFFMGV